MYGDQTHRYGKKRHNAGGTDLPVRESEDLTMKEFQLQTPYGFEVRCSLEIIPEQHHIQVYDWDEENGWEPWATATVQIGGLNENEVAIKNYSENEGILEALVDLGVIDPPHRRVASGFVMIDICRMNWDKIAEYSW